MLKSRNNLKATVSAQKLNASLNQQKLSASFGSGGGGYTLKDHAKLLHLDYLDSGHTGFAGIEFGTTAEWNAKPGYTPPRGMIVVYTDYATDVDPETGETITYANFKIGTGNAYLGNIQFVDGAVEEQLIEHMNDISAHIQVGERERWNNKLNYEEPEGDLLTFTRD